MELDPILAMDDSIPMMHQPKPSSSTDDNKNIAKDTNNTSNNPPPDESADTTKSSSSSSVPRDDDPVTSLLGSESSSSTTNNKPTIITANKNKPSSPQETTTAVAAAATSPDSQDLTTLLTNLLLTNQLPQSTISALQSVHRDNLTLKDKNSKLKSLLGRSAKAQRDVKNELEHVKKLCEELKVTNGRLERRVEELANRPTHMELLADFETNFDRALLALGGSGSSSSENNSAKKTKGGQSGGEDAAERHASLLEEEEQDQLLSAAAAEAAATSLYDELNTNPSSSSLYTTNRRLSSSHRTHHNNNNNTNNSDSLLLSELTEAKSRIQHLESLNTTLHHRTTHLEHTHTSLQSEHSVLKNTMTNSQLELRMSKMETEQFQRSLRDSQSTIQEMQLEINLLTQSAVEANQRAAEGMEVVQNIKIDKEYVDGLEVKVVALQDWALASAESRQVMSEKCRGLEGRVRELRGVVEVLESRLESVGGEGGEGGGGLVSLDGVEGLPLKKAGGGNVGSSASSLASTHGGERILWTKSSSLVVGAGMVGQSFLELGSVELESYETVMLRWKFDLTRDQEDIYFSILKGICEDRRKQRGADACFRNRHVKGGGGGDVSGAFAVQNACTLVWSNEMSWFRPKTIKWTVEAVAIEWND